MDGANWQEDNEYAFKQNNPVENRISNYQNINNGFRSEYFMACAIYDLWDGPDKGLPDNNNSLPGRPSNHPYNDRLLTGSLVGNDWILEEDNVSLSFNGLMRPIYENDGLGNGLKNIYEYIMYLMNVVYEDDCGARSGIARCFTENKVVIDIDFFENTNSTAGGNQLDRNTGISSDNLFELKSFEDRGVNLVCIPSTDELFINQDIIEEVPNHSCQLFHDDLESEEVYLTDNLRLGYNFTQVSQRSECKINPTQQSLAPEDMSAIMCNGITYSINNTLFEIGHIDGQTSTDFIVSNNCHFILDPMAVIKVNNNSKFLIAEGGILEIFPGSRIILNGDNAILEIKGNLIVHEGATFTFEGGSAGSGHVIFKIDKDDTPKDNITLEVDSKIEFVGNNSNDRVMEVPADAVFWLENPQASFEISNGFVALGRDALLNIGIPVTMNNVRYYAESGSKARSIVLWGHKHNILDVEIENVKEGLQSFNAVGGWPLKLNNVEISGADRGLLSEGKGATLTYFESEGNIMGIHISGSIWPNTFQNPKVTGAIRGTLFTGSSASNLVINKANYENNLEGVNYTGSGDLVLSCGKFHNIPGLSQPGNGITIKGGTVIAADALNYRAGRVSFAENKHTISLSDAKFYLNNGYNNLSFKNGNLALVGSSSFVTNYTGIIPSGYNLWDGSNVPTTLCLSPPGGYENYNATCLTRTGGFFTPICVSIPTSPIIDIYQFNNNQFDRCITNIAGNIPDKGTKNTGKMISTTRFVNKNLKDAVGVVLDTMNNPENRDYAGMIDYWAELLTEPEYEQPFSDEDYYYIDLMENKMMESLGLMLVNDSTLELSESGLGHFETVIEVQNHFIELLENDTTDAGVKLNNVFHFDLGTTYHLEGENELAYEQWNDMQSWANELYLEHTDYWLCQLAREELVKNCGNDPDSLDHIPVCQYEESEGSLVHLSIPGILNNNLSGKVLNIYPNPASSSVNLELNSTKKGIATLFIHTMEGTCVKVVHGININFGTNVFELNTSELLKGIYLITAQVNNSKWTGKLIIK